MGIINLQAPWIDHYRKIQALFENDPEVTVVYDAKSITVDIYVTNEEKRKAIEQLIDPILVFGNVTLTVAVIKGDGEKIDRRRLGRKYPYRYLGLSKDNLSVYEKAFDGNGAFSRSAFRCGPDGTEFTYIIFVHEIAQYFIDDTSDFFGVNSVLYEDLARDVLLKTPGVSFCTELVTDRD